MVNSEIELEELKKASKIRDLRERIPQILRDCKQSIEKLEHVPNPDGMIIPNKVVMEIYRHLSDALRHAEAGTVNDVRRMADCIAKAEMYAGDIDMDMSGNIRIISELGYRNGVEDALAQARLFGNNFMSFLIDAINYAREVEALDADAREHNFAKGIEIEARKIKKQGYINMIEAVLNKAIAFSEADDSRPLERCLDSVVRYANVIGVDVSNKIEEMKSVARGGLI